MNSQTKQKENVFDIFTKKYQLSKTLRFELRPVGKTEEFLRENKIFEKDKTIDKSYNQAKFYFDMLHREFIESVLNSKEIKNIGFKNFAEIFDEQNQIIRQKKNEKKNTESKEDRNKIQKGINKAESEISKARNNLYQQIRKIFDKKAIELTNCYRKAEEDSNENKEANNKTIEKSVLFSKNVLDILKEKFPREKEEEFKKRGWPSLYVEDKANPEQKVYIFDSFDRFTTYLTKFQQTRKNLYASKGESTSVITRIVSNFEIFLKNKEIFESKYSRVYQEIGFPRTDIFEVNYYLNCLTQEGVNVYNEALGEINKKTKEYRDKNKVEKSQLPLFKRLEKQILGEIKKEKELIQKTENKTEEEVFFERFKEFIEENERRIRKAKEIIKNLASGDFESEYNGIYLKRAAINTISRRWFSNYQEFLLKLPQASKSKDEKDEPKIKKFVSLADIKEAVAQLDGDIFKEKYYKKDKNDQKGIILREEDKWQQFLKIWKYEFESLFEDKYEDENTKEEIIYKGYNSSLEEAKRLNSFSKKEKETAVVKNYCDSALKIYQMMKYFNLGDKEGKDTPSDFSTEFYTQFDEYYEDYDFIRYYNAFRNYLTKKPYNEEKIKLNFGSGQFLGGWDKNKEKEKLGVILRKNGLYYLGVIHFQSKNIFDEEKHSDIYDVENSEWEKMDYKFIGDVKRQIPRIAFSKEADERFGLTEEIENIKKEYEQFQKEKEGNRELWNRQFDKNKTAKLIAYYQKVLELNGYKETYNLSWKNPADYSGIGEFFGEVAKRSYKVRFRKIDENYINNKINNGELYLFRIYNKDFAEGTTGAKNLHSLYFLNLFSDENLSNPIFALSGNAEVFYRPASIKPQRQERGKHKKKEIIEYKRYTEPKILFHIPILINFNSDEKPKRFNEEVNNFLAKNSDKINIIGIDRGEKNLLYYCVITQEGRILDYGSLNEINNVPYFEKLVEREVERRINRQSWQPVAKIKDLKKGYISYAIKKVCDLIEKYNAIVVLEDLNMRFKQIRSGIERTVYQQFEKALIDKLNYLVFKDGRDVFAPGGVLNGYQLTAPFVSFKDIGKQTGIIFYTNAEYTSQTDPLTGFRKNIYLSNSASNKKIKEALEKFKAIGWDEKEQSYYFTYNPANFKEDALSKDWTVYSKVPRVRREKNQSTGYWEYKRIDLNKEFEDLFEKYDFETRKEDILPEIKTRIEKDSASLEKAQSFDSKEKNFYQRFIYLFNLVLQIRNTYSLSIGIDESGDKPELEEIDYGVDFIASPVKPFFTTLGQREIGKKVDEKIKKEVKEKITEENLGEFKNLFENYDPNKKFDSDGVGAYNIARKSIIILNTIKENPEKPDLFVTKLEWDKFVQK